MGTVFVWIEASEGVIKKPSYEALTAAREIAKATGNDVAAVVISKAPLSNVGDIGKFGADKIFQFASDVCEPYNPDIYAQILLDALKKSAPFAVIAAATTNGKDLLPQVACSFETSVLQDCNEIKADGGRIVVRRPVYAGKAVVYCEAAKSPAFVTLRPNSVPLKQDAGKGEVENLALNLAEPKSKVVSENKVKAARPDLIEASSIVSGGRGLKGPENFKIRDELADVLGAAVGASRAVVDAGWRPYSEQVGQTGKTVSPNLYVAIGISGAIQHLAGMSSSKIIVAINKDRDAPIFKVASYGIVGDAFEVVPALVAELKKVLGK